MTAESTSPRRIFDAVRALGLGAIGASAEGREIGAAPFGDAGAGRDRLVVAGVHGDEPASVEAALDLVGWLRAAPPRGRAVWVVPVLNPDGLLRGTKDSARGVDLNRNFPAASFTTRHEPGYFPGAAPLSEPETAAFAGLVAARPWEGVVALHAPLSCVNYDGPAADWAEAVAGACGWPARADIGYPTPGSLGSWLGRDRGWPVLTIELEPGAYAPQREAARAALREATRFVLR
jgi:protein MpaA